MIALKSVLRPQFRGRWIGKLFITFPDNAQFVGTGWFIGPRTVMTAGHCVFSKANGGWAKSIEVVPGMDGTNRPYGSQVGTSFRSVQGWTQNSNPEYDYGAIILPNCTLGNKVGWFGFASLSDTSLKNLLVNTSGYPADKPYGTQWFNAGQVTQVNIRKIYYMIDTIGGQSGSPLSTSPVGETVRFRPDFINLSTNFKFFDHELSILIRELFKMMISYPHQPTSSEDPAFSASAIYNNPEIMEIQGTLVAVLESWPLQLLVDIGMQRYNIALSSTTQILRQGKIIPASQLHPGIEILIQGHGSPVDLRMTANTIHIQ